MKAEVVESESVSAEGIGLADYSFSFRVWTRIDYPHKFLPYDDETIIKSFTVNHTSQNNTAVYPADWGGSDYDFFLTALIYVMSNNTNAFLTRYDQQIQTYFEGAGEERFWIQSWNGLDTHSAWDGNKWFLAKTIFFGKLRRLSGLGSHFNHFFYNQSGQTLDVEIYYTGIARKIR